MRRTLESPRTAISKVSFQSIPGGVKGGARYAQLLRYVSHNSMS
jgi:hypothetical protein